MAAHQPSVNDEPTGGIYGTFQDEMASHYRKEMAEAQREEGASDTAEDRVLTDKQAATKFASYVAEADILASRGNYRKAIESYSKALSLYPLLHKYARFPLARSALIARSRCWSHLSYPEEALLDADRALVLWQREEAGDYGSGNSPPSSPDPGPNFPGKPVPGMRPFGGSMMGPGSAPDGTANAQGDVERPAPLGDSYKGLLAKADALYAATDFEHALVYYHRGHNKRPDVRAFRLGVQKCQEAVLNAIGDPSNHRLTLVGEQEFQQEMKERKKSIVALKERKEDPAADPDKYNDSLSLLQLSVDPEVTASATNRVPQPPSGDAAPRPRPRTRPGTACTLGGTDAPAEAILEADRRAKAGESGSTTLGVVLTSQHDTPMLMQSRGGDRQSKQGALSTTTPRLTTADLLKTAEARSADPHTDRELLGSLASDKAYLNTLLTDTEFQRVLAKDDTISLAVTEGLNFLEARKDFWRQQKPMYRRRQEQAERKVLSSRSARLSRPRTLTPLAGTRGQGRRPTTADHKSAAAATTARRRQARHRRTPSGTTAGRRPAGAQDDYFEATRYAIQTLSNINDALKYDSPELGLQLAKNFLARIGNMELQDKPRILANLYSAMGNTYIALGKLTLAAIHHRKSLDIGETYKYPDATLRALGDLGRTYRALGDHAKAQLFFERQAEVAVDPEDEGRAYVDIGRCLIEMEQYEDAITAGQTALEHARTVDDKICQVRANLLLGQAHMRTEQWGPALSFYEEHVRMGSDCNVPVTDAVLDELALVRDHIE